MSFLSLLVGVNSSFLFFLKVMYVFDFVLVTLPLGIRPNLTPEDREVKR